MGCNRVSGREQGWWHTRGQLDIRRDVPQVTLADVMIWKHVRASVGAEEVGDLDFDLELVFWGNFEMFQGKFCSDSWPPRSGNRRGNRGLSHKFGRNLQAVVVEAVCRGQDGLR